MIPPRITVLDNFTKYLEFYVVENQEESRYQEKSRWKINEKLLRSFNKRIKDDASLYDAHELVWLNGFLKEIETESQTREEALTHVLTYLESMIGQKVEKKFSAYHEYLSRSGNFISKADLMNEVRLKIIKLQKSKNIFAKFDRTKANFNTFVGNKYVDTILGEYLCFSVDIRKYSEAGLLRNIPQYLLREALISYVSKYKRDRNHRNYYQDNYELSKCHLAWYCFEKIYVPTTAERSRKLVWPNQQQLESIASQYNQLLSSSTDRDASSRKDPEMWESIEVLRNQSVRSPVNSATIDKSLKDCVQAVRNYTSLRPEDSLAGEIGTSEDNNSISVGDLETTWETALEEIEDREELTGNRERVNEYIIDAYDRFVENKKIFRLFLGISIIQEDLAKIFLLKKPRKSKQICGERDPENSKNCHQARA